MGWISMSLFSLFIIVFVGVHSAEAASKVIDCKVVDMEVNELLQEVSIPSGRTIQVERWKMEKYIPKGLDFYISHKNKKVRISETQIIKKKQQVTHEFVRNVYPQFKYSIECTHPYQNVPALVETTNDKERTDS